MKKILKIIALSTLILGNVFADPDIITVTGTRPPVTCAGVCMSYTDFMNTYNFYTTLSYDLSSNEYLSAGDDEFQDQLTCSDYETMISELQGYYDQISSRYTTNTQTIANLQALQILNYSSANAAQIQALQNQNNSDLQMLSQLNATMQQLDQEAQQMGC